MVETTVVMQVAGMAKAMEAGRVAVPWAALKAVAARKVGSGAARWVEATVEVVHVVGDASGTAKTEATTVGASEGATTVVVDKAAVVTAVPTEVEAMAADAPCTRAAQRASSSEIDPPAGLSRTVRCSRRRTVPQTAPRSPVPPSLRIGTPHRSSCLQTSHQPTPRTETATPGTLDRPRDCTPRPNPQPCHRAPGQTPMR